MAVLSSIATRGATEIDGIYYNLDNRKSIATVTRGENKYVGNIVIPSYVSYNGTVYTVTSIGNSAFADCTWLGSVTLPSTIENIQYYAFQNSNLSSIVIPQSVKQIYYPFAGCNNLSSIVVEEGNTTYDSRNNCNAIIETAKNSLIAGCRTTVIPEGVETISVRAFQNLTGLKSLYIPSSVKNIYSAFDGCTSLESIEVDKGNETFDSRNNCNAIINTSKNELVLGCKSTVIPNDVVSIGYNAFTRSGVTSLVIPASLTEIKEYTFDGCNITSIVVEEGNPVFDSRDNCNAIIKTETNTLFWGGPNTVIPTSVTTIGSYSFRGCTGLTSINIPANVTTIEYCAFEGSGLKTLTIPATVTGVGFALCNQCANLTDIYLYAETVPEEHILEEDMYAENITLHVPASALEQYKEQWQDDGYNAIVAIGEPLDAVSMFKYRYDYEALEATITGLVDGAETIADLVIPDHVEHLGNTYTVTGFDYAGYEGMISVTVPPSINSFGKSAFNKANGLQKVIVKDLWAWCKINFYTLSSNPLRKAKHIYSDVETEITELQIPMGLMEIGNYAFSYCEGITSVVIPSSVASIGNYAFGYCSGLNSIIIPGNVMSIGAYAFQGCRGLTSVNIHEGTKIIGTQAFYNCDMLKSIVIPQSVDSVSWHSFYGCPNLQEIKVMGDTAKYLRGPYLAFSGVGTAEAPCKLLVPAEYVENYRELFSDGKLAGGYFTLEAIESETSEDLNQTTFVEYFIDNDPGLGKATQVEVEVDENGAADFEVPGTALHYGLNLVGIRLMTVFDDGTVSYSPTTLHSVYKYHAQDAQTVGIEYFVNKDPGVGKATRVNLTGESVTFDLPVAQLEVGINVLGLRAISINSETGVTYGATTYQYVYRSASTGNKPIERIEYFWDEDPGQGNATPLAFTMVGDSAVVDCNINHEGIYGEHVLSVRALAGGVWSPLYQQMVILPNLSPLDGLISLDPDNEEDIETGLFQTLPSLIGALSTRGFNIGVDIHVADANYVFMVSEESLYFVQALYEYMLETNFYLNMKADHQATFNFILPEEFIYIHQNELPSIVASVQAMFSHVVTENISILINGQAYQYDGFQVEPNDLMALKNIYNRLNGKNWTDKKWSFQSNGRDKKELPGVGFNDAGRVTSIELNTNNLKGVLGNDWALMLPYLTYLNMSYNDIEGDLSPWLKETTSLKSLYMANNCLTEISETLPSSVSSIDLRYQFFIRDAVGNLVVNDEAIARQKPVLLYISNKQQVALPSLFTYNHKYKDHSYSPTMYIYDDKMVNIALNSSQNGFVWLSGEDYKAEQDARYIVTMYTENIGGYYPVKLRYVMGDANMSGATDVLDVQLTLNRILSSAAQFNYSAANTYTDDKINVQDIVCTVNIVLAQEQGTVAGSRGEQAAVMPEAWLYTENGRLLIASATEMGAIDVELAGVSTSQVSLLLNHKQFQMIGRNTEQGSRYVIFSPTGQAIPAGEATALLKISASAEPVAVLASDIDAQAVSVALNQHPTSIAQLRQGSLKAHFDGDQLVVAASAQQENVSLRLLSANGTLIMKSQMDVVDRSGRRVNAHVPSGVYLLEMTTANGNTKVVKLMKR